MALKSHWNEQYPAEYLQMYSPETLMLDVCSVCVLLLNSLTADLYHIDSLTTRKAIGPIAIRLIAQYLPVNPRNFAKTDQFVYHVKDANPDR